MKLQSTATLRAQFNKTQPDKPSMKEQLLAQQHRRAHVVIEWLRENWDGTTIVLPLPVNILNTRRQLHWAVRNELKNQYCSHCDLIELVRPRIMPAPPFEIPALWRVSVGFYGAGVTDSDNAHAMLKFVNDWLKGKWCIDDAPEYLEVVEFVNGVDRKVPRLEFRTV